jgi:competence protein ComEC
MLRWAPYPFIRISLSFIAGIVWSVYRGEEFGYTTELFAFFVTLLIITILVARNRKSIFLNNLAGLVSMLCFFTAGILLTNNNNETDNGLHLSNIKEQPAYYTGIVSDYVIQKAGYQSTVITVNMVSVAGEWQHAAGKVQIAVPDDSAAGYQLKYGDKLLIRGAPQPVPSPANPNQFNYKSFLANKNIYHRHYLQANQYQLIGFSPANVILYYSIKVRRALEALLRNNIPEQREYSISSALVLGIKDEIDNAIRDAYAGTGTMHVLAVSGLHVGLIYGLLMLLFARFKRNSGERIGVAIILICILWLYAFVTGLSPSVLRAVVMLSMVALANAATKRQHTYNTLAFAAFIMLWYNPYFLLEVSFQLSFLAVLGIVYLQPRFYKLLQFRNWLADKVWMLFTVSIAAQLATLPLGIYYFHQFPVYFFLANLLVVPVATLVLYLGVLSLAFSWLPYLGVLLFKTHSWLIWVMNEFNLFMTSLPNAILSGISITELQVWLLYVFLFFLLLFFAFKNIRYLAMATGIIAILSVQQVLESLNQHEQTILAVYNTRGNSALAFVKGTNATMLTSTGYTQASPDFNFNIQPHLWALGIYAPDLLDIYTPSEKLAQTILPDSNSIVSWNNFKILLLRKPLQYQPTSFREFDYIIVSQNVKLRPEELKQIRAKKVILDTSNAPWHAQRLEQQLQQAAIPFYNVAQSGAFVLSLK